jgi:DNA-binding IclR family transcriptional regulator
VVFPAHRTAGLLLLAKLSGSELDQLYTAERYRDQPAERPHLALLRTELARIRRKGGSPWTESAPSGGCQMALSASALVTGRPRAPYSCRSPNISMRMD